MRSTRVVGEAIARAARPPRVWLQMSTATIYAHRFDAPNDEATGPSAVTSPARPCRGDSASRSRAPGRPSSRRPTCRAPGKVALRSAIVMSPARGGIFDTLLGLVRQGSGAPCGDGRQMVSWIHDADFLRAVHWLIAHEEVDGAVNLVSPGALPNAEFMKSFRRAAGAWFGLPASGLVLEFGTWLKRTEPELVLKSRWAYPGRLLAGGFAFEHPEWDEAVVDLCRRWRAELD